MFFALHPSIKFIYTKFGTLYHSATRVPLIHVLKIRCSYSTFLRSHPLHVHTYHQTYLKHGTSGFRGPTPVLLVNCYYFPQFNISSFYLLHEPALINRYITLFISSLSIIYSQLNSLSFPSSPSCSSNSSSANRLGFPTPSSFTNLHLLGNLPQTCDLTLFQANPPHL